MCSSVEHIAIAQHVFTLSDLLPQVFLRLYQLSALVDNRYFLAVLWESV